MQRVCVFLLHLFSVQTETESPPLEVFTMSPDDDDTTMDYGYSDTNISTIPYRSPFLTNNKYRFHSGIKLDIDIVVPSFHLPPAHRNIKIWCAQRYD